MTEEERRRWENDRRMIRFYNSLEGVLKRHNPVEYILAMSYRLHECSQDPKRWRQTPPFRVVHSIEACCAYARGHSEDPVTLNRLFKAMNVYHEHSDPMQQDALGSGLLQFLLLAHREQMELQYSHSGNDFGRAMTLFAEPGALPRSSKAFNEKYGLTPFQWIKLCFLSATAAANHPAGLFPTSAVHNYVREAGLQETLPDNSVAAFFALASRTPRQIGDRFREERKKLPLYLHSCIRSALLETPLIALGPDIQGKAHMLLLIRDIMFRLGNDGLYRLMKGLDQFDSEIGDGFGAYVGRVLQHFEGTIRLLGEAELEKAASGKSCDFLLELPDAVVLVETKAVSFVKTSLTDKSILEETSTRQIAKAVQQLYATAYDLKTGRLDHFRLDKSKPLIGIVVTLGEIPMVNLDWYFDTFIMALASPKLEPPVFPSDNLTRRPISMSARTFEQLVMACNALKTSPVALFDQKQTMHPAMVGDWNTFLNQIVRDNEHEIRSLPFMRLQTARLMVSLGVPEADVEETVISRGTEGGVAPDA
jgi:hypothetical protein